MMEHLFRGKSEKTHFSSFADDLTHRLYKTVIAIQSRAEIAFYDVCMAHYKWGFLMENSHKRYILKVLFMSLLVE